METSTRPFTAASYEVTRSQTKVDRYRHPKIDHFQQHHQHQRASSRSFQHSPPQSQLVAVPSATSNDLCCKQLVGQRRIPNLHTTARCGVSGPICRTHRGTGSAKSSSPSQLRRQQPLRWGEFTCTEILVTDDDDDDGEPKVDRREQESTEAE